MVEAVAFFVASLLMLALGIAFWRGRLLRLIAGNTFLKEEQLKTPKQLATGRYVGYVCFVVALMFLANGALGLSDYYGSDLSVALRLARNVLIAIAIVALLLAVYFANRLR